MQKTNKQYKIRKEIIMFNLIYNNTVLFILLVSFAVGLIREFNLDINEYHNGIIYFNELGGVIAIALAIDLHISYNLAVYALLGATLMITILFDIAIAIKLNRNNTKKLDYAR